jgi:hypothetical protein
MVLQSMTICAKVKEEEKEELPMEGARGLAGEGFSGEEKMPSMFSTPKLSLVFSGSVIPVRL